ncbi:aldo/keto reductase [Microbacterium sp. M3]|uniref:Aldo/keto reductase n=1 Tax=Microbacterium arthrosphaerae TaxID=792652 RepID=A0ABU4GYJ5_9MICO|nr:MULTISPECIES: aldo/keto reductase [Microbacterium]MDW4572158.1 aldo/keto reductase [Microbacterium arthrosphaerae]MDW7606013.1 aldo/keto reductase [Microbacterium sp. M3]
MPHPAPAVRPELPALTRLGYGAANLGNLFREISDEQAWAILDAAWESGIRYYDTAPHYGLGLSERRLGAFLRTKPRDEYVVSTKAGRLLRPNPDDDGGLDLAADFHVRTSLRREWDFSAEGIRASLHESLERLGLDRVDVLYLHDPERHDLALALREGFPALEQLRAEGAVDAIGIGAMTAEALAAAVKGADLDLIMIAGRYTLLEQPAADEVLPACHARGTGVVAASVFNSGLLAKDEPSRDDRYEYGRMPEPLWERLQRLVAVCRAHDVPLPAAAVQFALRDPAVRSVVVGGSRPEQLRRNAELMALDLPAGLWDDLAADGLIR